jgi:hypothetical protein
MLFSKYASLMNTESWFVQKLANRLCSWLEAEEWLANVVARAESNSGSTAEIVRQFIIIKRRCALWLLRDELANSGCCFRLGCRVKLGEFRHSTLSTLEELRNGGTITNVVAEGSMQVVAEIEHEQVDLMGLSLVVKVKAAHGVRIQR